MNLLKLSSAKLMVVPAMALAMTACNGRPSGPASDNLDNFSAAAPTGATGTTSIGGRANDTLTGAPVSSASDAGADTASGTTSAAPAGAPPTSASAPADTAKPADSMAAPSAASSPKPDAKAAKKSMKKDAHAH